MPPTSVLRSRQPFVLFLQPVVEVPLPVTAPPATPELLPGKPPSLGPDWPYCRSISMPSTALTRPTSNTKSGRNRVLAYHSRSLSRDALPSEQFLAIAVTWSDSAVNVTF